jgi:hypothetical protein
MKNILTILNLTIVGLALVNVATIISLAYKI